MLEMVPVHTERGSWESYTAQVLPDILSYVPQAPPAGLLHGSLQSCTSLVNPGKRLASCCSTERPAASYSCPMCATGSLRCQHPHRWCSLCLLTCSTHLDSQARTSTAAAGTSDVTDVHWGTFFNLGNLAKFMVFNVQVINTVT